MCKELENCNSYSFNIKELGQLKSVYFYWTCQIPEITGHTTTLKYGETSESRKTSMRCLPITEATEAING